MKLIKQLETNRNHTVAQSVTYSNVFFPQGFANFLSALCTERLIPFAQRTNVEGKYRWSNDIGNGGILLETTEHPFVHKNEAGDVTVVGSKEKLEIFETLLRLHEVEHEGATKPEDIQIKVVYHDHLNPKFWNEDKTLKEDVKAKLLEAANAFVKFLKVTDLVADDITFTGSNANYNWTETSDIDLHVIVDFNSLEAEHGDLVEEYFSAKKTVFNDLHDVVMLGQTVEFYVQDEKESHQSSGVFSIKDNIWKKEPQHEQPSVDDNAVRVKTAELMNRIDEVTSNCNKAAAVEELMDKLKKMRKAGLAEAGEFSVENLVFKQLQRNGYLEKLADCKTKAFDRELSIEDEEWASLC